MQQCLITEAEADDMQAASAGVQFVYIKTQTQWEKKNANKCLPHTGEQ